MDRSSTEQEPVCLIIAPGTGCSLFLESKLVSKTLLLQGQTLFIDTAIVNLTC